MYAKRVEKKLKVFLFYTFSEKLLQKEEKKVFPSQQKKKNDEEKTSE